MSRENRVEDQVEEVVARQSSRCLPAGQAPDAIFRPADLELQLVQGKSLGAEERWRGTARDVVAGKGEEVDEDGEAERDAESTEPADRASEKSGLYVCFFVIPFPVGTTGCDLRASEFVAVRLLCGSLLGLCHCDAHGR